MRNSGRISSVAWR